MTDERTQTGREELIESICRKVGIKGRDKKRDRGYFRRADLIHLASWIDAHGGEDKPNEA